MPSQVVGKLLVQKQGPFSSAPRPLVGPEGAPLDAALLTAIDKCLVFEPVGRCSALWLLAELRRLAPVEPESASAAGHDSYN